MPICSVPPHHLFVTLFSLCQIDHFVLPVCGLCLRLGSVFRHRTDDFPVVFPGANDHWIRDRICLVCQTVFRLLPAFRLCFLLPDDHWTVLLHDFLLPDGHSLFFSPFRTVPVPVFPHVPAVAFPDVLPAAFPLPLQTRFRALPLWICLSVLWGLSLSGAYRECAFGG